MKNKTWIGKYGRTMTVSKVLFELGLMILIFVVFGFGMDYYCNKLHEEGKIIYGRN